MTERLLTPSKVTAWLDCAHFLTLRHLADDGGLAVEHGGFGAFAQLLMDKGLEHERRCLDHYRSDGKSVYVVPERLHGESFAAWVARVGNPMAGGHDVIYQMPFVHDRIRGIADFLIRVERGPGEAGYEPLDAKLARAEAKPGHVLQLCFYAEAIAALTGTAPRAAHIWLGSGRTESILLSDVLPYWRRLRQQLASVLAAEPSDATTTPQRCDHCQFCEFAGVCEAEWRAKDSLVYVANIRRTDRELFEAADISTLAALAAHAVDAAHVEGVDPARELRLVGQAALQVIAREAPDLPPPHTLLAHDEATPEPVGFGALPPPDAGDVFLDYEGHPFWQPDTGLFFLFGLLTLDDTGEWTYEARWAHDRVEEAEATAALIRDLADRRTRFPGMHVYHYNHTERSALERLAAEHGVGEQALGELVDSGLFVDLLAIVRDAMQVGVESYGLKHVERLTPYERGHDIDQGAGAVVEYDVYTTDHDPARLARIATYNEDDVRATRALRDWLFDERPNDVAWRDAVFERPESELAHIDDQIVALHAFAAGTPEHLLGDLLGYWRRESRATLANMLVKTGRDDDDRLADPDVVTGLELMGRVERIGKHGRPIIPALEFRYPRQEVGRELTEDNAGVVYPASDGRIGFAQIASHDPAARQLQIVWNDRSQELDIVPTTVVLNDWVSARPKPDALSLLAAAVLDPNVPGPVSRVGEALLRRELPCFTGGHGPRGGKFTDDLDDVVGWAPHLDESYVAIQGPPGTGKTYTGAQIVHALVRQGKRVGITAMSHNAIDNFLSEIVDVFEQHGDSRLLRAIRKVKSKDVRPIGTAVPVTSNDKCANLDYNVVAGTPWLFSRADIRNAPVDVLIIDEAGQLALADALAASTSARNMILLGDPLQLPQVAQATHPGCAGSSVLEHVLGADRTVPDDRGVFLGTTRRMHPDVCGFTSEQFYEGLLAAHSTCAIQATARGTGLRWLEAKHTDRSTDSPEEAWIIADAIAELIGLAWTDALGRTRALGTADFMVVAPYNDQVHLLRDTLDRLPETRGVRVGTVDKFQGQEAPIVFFSMTTSSADDMPRGPEFLFSRNRLNVAVSRARGLAHVVCTDALLDSRARDVEGMRLISALCAFAEHATDPV